MTKLTNNSIFSKEKTAKEYEKYYQTKYKKADLAEKKLLMKLLSYYTAERILEVGCGTGHFMRWFESIGLESIGIDNSKFMLNEAKRIWSQGCFLQSESEHLPFKEKSVDVAIYITSLEFMPNVSAAFVEASRIAREGIIIGLMNKYSVATLEKKFKALTSKNSFYKKATFYSISDINKILNKTFHEKFAVSYWSTTVFPRIFGELDSSRFPFGTFLGIAVKFGDNLE